MKKIIFSMIMLCTALSTWSQTTYTVTKSCSDGNNGIVSASDLGMITGQYDKTTNTWKDVLGITYIGSGRVIISIEFDMKSGSIDQCESTNGNWKVDDTGKWEQDGTFAYDENLVFKSITGCFINNVTITYHKHTFIHHGAVAATCTSTGKKEYWECSDCGRKYYDDKGSKEVAKEEDLILLIDPTNHPDALEEHPLVEATCTTAGNVQYWHCDHCNKNFEDKDGKGNEIVNVVIPKEQGSHNHLTFVAQKAATCMESGYTVNHYHCSDCNKNFEDKDGTTLITNEVVIPAINLKNKKFNEAVAPTTETTGNVAHWQCPDCEKNFEDEGCTNELTEWILDKLVNMMHFDFAGTSAPIEQEHYLNTTKFNFTDDGDVILTVNDKSVTYDKDMINKVKFSNGTPTVTISANEDPDNMGTYYSTFYSKLESYAVPEGFTAYRGEISDDGTKLNLTSVKDGVMKRGEGYILKATANSGSMEVTANASGGNSDNVLLGTDVATTLSTNDYALSLGQNGVGFYLWSGEEIGANKAYLTLPGNSAKAFTFQFADGETTGIQEASPKSSPEGKDLYNLNGVRVKSNYKGIIIKNGKKVYQK